MKISIPSTKQEASRTIVTVLTVFAFIASYMHGQHYAEAHHAGPWSWGYAAVPELILLSSLLRGVYDLRFWIGVLVSVAWTFWVNISGSLEYGPEAVMVSLIAPVAAVLTAWIGHSKAQPEPVAAPAPKRRKPGVVESGIEWANAQRGPLTEEMVIKARGCSAQSARKILAARKAA